MTQHERIIDFDVPQERIRVASGINKLRGKWRLSMCRYRPRRSDRQNAWYWGCILPALREAITEAAGEPVTVDQVHEWAKGRFLGKPFVDKATGEVIDAVPGSSADLNTDEFSQFCEQIRKFASEMFDLNIPDPV